MNRGGETCTASVAQTSVSLWDDHGVVCEFSPDKCFFVLFSIWFIYKVRSYGKVVRYVVYIANCWRYFVKSLGPFVSR